MSVRPSADMKNGAVFESDSNTDAAFDFCFGMIDFEGPIDRKSVV